MRSLYIAPALSKPVFSAPLRIVRGGAPAKPAARPLPRRGVRVADYTIGGYRVLEAIDSRGECVKRVRVIDGVYEAVPREWLAGYLDRVDPEPQLHRATDPR